MAHGKIVSISGPLIIAEDLPDAKMYEVVRIGDEKLFGEIIEMHGKQFFIQCYEETLGLKPGEPVELEGFPLSVQLGPGLITSIYDGVQRPLELIYDRYGAFIARGIDVAPLPYDKEWHFFPLKQKGDKVNTGDKIGYVQETPSLKHYILIPDGVSGTITEIKEIDATLKDTIAKVISDKKMEHEIKMVQVWPVRKKRPVKNKIVPDRPFITGQRVVDMFFPVAEGGTACVPGPFGSGKTVIQHQLAKWADADIIVYVGCGERGNEMTDVLMEFPHLKDPKTGRSLMERTVLIANTSNMPVAAREASVFSGITIAEYFRDMGYKVALMADSTSRWAEAMREISGRLEEMPGEEGYPAYLSSRIASFYERAGKVQTLAGESGSLSVIGAVSPPGGDLSEPVVQSTLRVVKVFWSLEASLAYARHFPAIHWLNSYSLYQRLADRYFEKEVNKLWPHDRELAMSILQKESELQEIVRLVGTDALSEKEKLVMLTAKSVKEDFLHQNAFDEVDTYTSPLKQYYMLHNIISLHQEAEKLMEKGLMAHELEKFSIREKIGRVKYIPESRIEECNLQPQIDELSKNWEAEHKENVG
jgi:V/A-type H+/Na+-transporting ATPase subunit A